MSLVIEFIDYGRPPKEPPDPLYPHGVDVDLSNGAETVCSIKLPKVTTTGLFIAACDVCGKKVGVTAAGRADDPRSLKISCYRHAQK